jgi:hypothetical protein
LIVDNVKRGLVFRQGILEKNIACLSVVLDDFVVVADSNYGDFSLSGIHQAPVDD